MYCRLIQRADGVPNRNFLDWFTDPLNFEESRILERNRLKAEAAAQEEALRLERADQDRRREIEAAEQLERDRENAERERRQWIEHAEATKRQQVRDDLIFREAILARRAHDEREYEREKRQWQREEADRREALRVLASREEREYSERARQAQIAPQPPEQPVNPLGDFLGAFEADAAWVVTNGGGNTKVISHG